MSIERVDPPYAGTESEQLVGFLDYQRATLALKCEDLDTDQLNRTLTPSTMTLGGMLKHLALCEDSWFSHRFAGNDEAEPWVSVDWEADSDWDWHPARTWTRRRPRRADVASTSACAGSCCT